ncbi:MAG: hypothetical protein ACREPE_01400, partial [Lysobacter sp.]
MKLTLTTIAIAFALSTAACDASPPAGHGHEAAPAAPAAPPVAATRAPALPAVAAPKLQADMRALWQGHVVETRHYAMAIQANDKTRAGRAAAAVVANATSISNAVAGFYGAAAGKEMLRLLGGHWGGVKALTDAQHKADQAGVQKAMGELITNASDIAKFLAGANPNLPEDAVRGLLVAHGGHHA